MNVNWNNGTYVIQALAAYAALWAVPAIIELTAAEISLMMELVSAYGIGTAIMLYLNGGVEFFRYAKQIRDAEAALGPTLSVAIAKYILALTGQILAV